MAELSINILQDENGIIVAQKIFTEDICVERNVIEQKKARIAELKAGIEAYNNEIAQLEAEIADANVIIEKADAIKAEAEAQQSSDQEIVQEQPAEEQLNVAEISPEVAQETVVEPHL